MRLKQYRFLLYLILLYTLIPYSALASLSVTFLEAGAGGAALLKADGQTILLGTGAETDRDVLLSSLADFDIPKIDLLVSTLPREDDTGWIGAVLNKYETVSLWLPGTQAVEQADDQALDDIQSSGVKTVTFEPGEQMDVGKAKVTVVKFNGQADGAAHSLALRIEYDGHSFLFLPGADAMNDGALMESGADLHADVISMGGEGIPPKPILDSASPLWLILGGEPQPEALAGLAESGIHVLNPVKDGTVTFTADGKALAAEHEASGITIQKSVNVRKEASTKSGKVTTLTKGSVVSILGTAAGDEGLWYHIEADGKVGFVRGDLIKEVTKEEAETLLALATPKPRRSSSGTQDSGNRENTQEEAPVECH